MACLFIILFVLLLLYPKEFWREASRAERLALVRALPFEHEQSKTKKRLRRLGWELRMNPCCARRDGWSVPPHRTIHLAANHLQGSRDDRPPARLSVAGALRRRFMGRVR